MKITLDSNSYITLAKEKDTIKLGFKVKEGKSSYVLSTILKEDDIDRIITELISLRVRIKNEEKS